MKYTYKGVELDSEVLSKEHFVNNKSSHQIARELNIPEGSIKYIFKRLGIVSRTSAEANKLHFSRGITKEFLYDLYVVQGLNSEQIREKTGYSTYTICKYLRLHNIPFRKTRVWNKGITAKDDVRLAMSGKKRSLTGMPEGYKPWNTGLSKEEHPSIARFAEVKKQWHEEHDTSGINSPSFGRKHTEEFKRQQSLRKGGTGIPYQYSRNGYVNFTQELKEYVRCRDNYVCQECGCTNDECLSKYNQSLHVHHIDYNKKNSVEDNLVSLCVSCHAKTNDGNKQYWMDKYNRKLFK